MSAEEAEQRKAAGEPAGYHLFSSHSALAEALEREAGPADGGLSPLMARACL